MKKIIAYLILIEFCLFFNTTNGQSNTILQYPISFTYTSSSHTLTSENLISEYQINKPNIDSIISYFSEHPDTSGVFIYGTVIPANFNIIENSTCDTLDDGSRLFRLKFSTIDATSLNYVLNNYFLPNGTFLFIYSSDRNKVDGPFSSFNPNQSGKFMTDLFESDTVIFEYWQPTNTDSIPILNISKIVYGYRNYNSENIIKIKKGNNKLLDDNLNCSKDVNCPEGDQWCVEKRSIVQIIVVSDNLIAAEFSGCLLNNTNNDRKPYILTALHATRGFRDYSEYYFKFAYMRQNCGDARYYSQGITYGSQSSPSGCSLKAFVSATDCSLLKMDFTPNYGDMVTYAGWAYYSQNYYPDNEPQPNCTMLHHPYINTMKISQSDGSPAILTDEEGSPQSNGNFWKFPVQDGETNIQSGSSGAPFFNANHKVIAQLKGHEGGLCKSTNAYGGRLSHSLYALRQFLDPKLQYGDVTCESMYIGRKITEFGLEVNRDESLTDLKFTTFNLNEVETGSGIINGADKAFILYNSLEDYMSGGRLNFDCISKKYIDIKPCSYIFGGVDFHAYIGCSTEFMLSNPNNENPYTYTSGCSVPQPPIMRSSEGRNSNKISIPEERTHDVYKERLLAIPNPSDASVKIKYAVSQPSFCNITISNELGEMISTVIDNPNIKTGGYSVDFDTSKLPAGTYFITMRTLNNTITKQIVVIH
ncbi:MAG: T9SS type A sorting domain-containing protein [Candidatus Kapabacteria bacterium]|nr:T9SS type A sorting domain-containing protein [Candidatus Kapabacteria bacterium]